MIRNTVQWFSMALLNNKSFFGFFEPLIKVLFSGYSINRYRAKILKVRHENKEVYTLILKVSRFWRGFNAGQFIELSVEYNGAKITRFFSISSSPQLLKSQRIIEITIQKQINGRITPRIAEIVKIGQYLSISSAKGEFCVQDQSQPLLFIAAGSGITPFRSLLAELSQEASMNDIHLLYYAKDSNHLFVEEFKEYAKLYDHISVDFINTTESGHFSLNHASTYCPSFQQRLIYICGPGKMIESCKKLLLENQIVLKNIKYEYFGAKPIDNLSLDTAGMVRFNQSLMEVNSNSNSKKTLLELAESLGLKPITGCRMGICHQCICEKKQGMVYNTLTKSYSDTGSEEVQLCISVPVGDVSINL